MLLVPLSFWASPTLVLRKAPSATAEVGLFFSLGCLGCRKLEATHSWAPSDVVDGRSAGVSVRDHETELQEGGSQDLCLDRWLSVGFPCCKWPYPIGLNQGEFIGPHN